MRYYAHANSLYSIAATTNATGAVVERYSYNAYGVRTVKNSAGATLAKSAVNQDRGFTSYKLDSETGLYFARARMFSAKMGRFIARDPIGYIDGHSLYGAYFAPNGFDPMGLSSMPWYDPSTYIVQKAIDQLLDDALRDGGKISTPDDPTTEPCSGAVSNCYDLDGTRSVDNMFAIDRQKIVHMYYVQWLVEVQGWLTVTVSRTYTYKYCKCCNDGASGAYKLQSFTKGSDSYGDWSFKGHVKVNGMGIDYTDAGGDLLKNGVGQVLK